MVFINLKYYYLKNLKIEILWRFSLLFSLQLNFYCIVRRTHICRGTAEKNLKELSLCHKLFIFVTQCLIFQTLNSVRSKNPSLKYKRCTSSGSKNIGIWKFKFVAKDQFLWPGWAFRPSPSSWLVQAKLLLYTPGWAVLQPSPPPPAHGLLPSEKLKIKSMIVWCKLYITQYKM